MHEDENWDDPSIKELTDMQKYAFVTKRAWDNNSVGYCYRENTELKIDSGWRFIFGDEDDDYLDNPDNTITKDLSEIAEWKPELKPVLGSRRGSEFEWDDEKKAYIPID
ncbi:immunity protein Imm33 domain-containing protein [Dysgonomonas macrotermitis]|uniref:Immunity protein Imm33 domain-containing protein n=1 Tax=Dysgonomonas macrotermitis TaxID=1346286 RepID=A0A1M5BE06_9BACT|nr:DUF2185 domain-containing protein [Dysgonomonas macrotermitis]SHF40686.1 hypothetical protein SAMN05444362_10635 [Dysgonomonas macrotermitis]